MWFLLMLVILVTNGMSAYGLKVIAGWADPTTLKFPYLCIWYAGGMASILIPMLMKGLKLGRKELMFGALMAALSLAGQVAMAVALSAGVPGHMVFPIAIGGSILVVALSSQVFFHEKMNRLTLFGVGMGFVAVILLSVS